MTRRVRSRWVALLASLPIAASLVLVSPGVAFAGTQGTNCPSDPSRIRLWENVIGDTQNDNDSYWKCSSDINLATDNHTLPGACAGWVGWSETWNDCVSSFTVWVPAGWKLCLYADADYENLKATYFGPIDGYRYDAGASWGDHLSSFRWTTGSC